MRKRYRVGGITKNQFWVLTSALVIMVGVFMYFVNSDSKIPEDTGNYVAVVETSEIEEIEVADIETEEVTDPLKQEVQGDNNTYPFNTMSADWGVELYDEGFMYYEIPQEYKDAGGCFPEVVQAYLWSLCKERGIDYYIVIALIERESGYRWGMTGDSGNSKGYMQIYEKWHYDRMEAEGVTDLYNPYQNIRVGLNYLQEIQDKYLSGSGVNCVLMVYNMGETTAKKHWSNGTYSTKYSRAIVNRAQEIKQELQEIKQELQD